MEEDLPGFVGSEVGCADCIGPDSAIGHVAIVGKPEAVGIFVIETLTLPVAGSFRVFCRIHFRVIFLIDDH